MSESEIMKIGGILMGTEYKRVSVKFSNSELVDEPVRKFGFYLYKDIKDGVDGLQIHMLHGLLHLLSDVKGQWNKLRKSKNFPLMPAPTENPSADDNQPTVQSVVDCTEYIIYRISEFMDDKLEDNDVSNMLHAIIGLSISNLESWTDVDENSSLLITTKMIAKLLDNIKDLKPL